MTTLPDLNDLPLPALFAEFARSGLVRRLLELARDEDLGPGGLPGDITTRAWAPPAEVMRVAVVARSPGIAAGLEALPILLEIFAPRARVLARMQDGEALVPGAQLARLEGHAHELLALERTLLNLLGRLSGIATQTRRYLDAMGHGSRARLFDTRKTTPGLRVLEKYAVRCGGAFSHRIGLHDAVLVKDNHIAGVPLRELAAHAEAAARRARSGAPIRFVEFEVDTLEQLRELLRVPAGLIDIVLLDNMPTEILRAAVELRASANTSILLEASGGVSLTTIAEIARTGIDRISVGAMTHSATCLDLALDVEDTPLLRPSGLNPI